RPGYEEISVTEELQRVVPVVKALSQLDVQLSIDTYRSEVAEAAMKLGATMINDKWAGLYDEKIIDVVSKYEGEIILMHNGYGHRSMHVVDVIHVSLFK